MAIKPGFFIEDFELIRSIANVDDTFELSLKVEDFYYNHPPSGLLRGLLKIRVSKERLIYFASEVLQKRMF